MITADERMYTIRIHTLDGLSDDRLAVALDVLRTLRSLRREGVRSIWYPAGAVGFDAAVDLGNVGLVMLRETGAGVLVMLRPWRRIQRMNQRQGESQRGRP